MTAAAAPRLTKRRASDQGSAQVVNGTTIYAGTMVAIVTASGFAAPAALAAANGAAIGVAEETVTGDGTAAMQVPYRRGCFQFANSGGGDAIAKKDIGALCYVVDDSTVALTSNSAARVAAGRIIDVDAAGVWVDVAHA